MGTMSPLIPTFEDYTGSIFTVNDAYSVTPPFTGSYIYPNGARNQPGRAFYTTYNPTGSSTPYWVKLRYVRYSPTAAVTFTAGSLPAVFWKDNTFTTVTPTSSEGTLGLNGVCGILLNTTTTSANLTGNWTLICVAGYLTGMLSVATTVAGSIVIGAAVAQTVGVSLVGTAPPNKPLYIATTAIASGLSNGIVCCEDITP
jgi:hypothetical protein